MIGAKKKKVNGQEMKYNEYLKVRLHGSNYLDVPDFNSHNCGYGLYYLL